jgi:sterol 3beta-glucosyltransferase
MRIGIQTWGSEGDNRPMLALAHGLVRAGHDVTFVYTELGRRRYDEAARALGVPAVAVASPVVDDPERLDAIGRAALETHDPVRQGRMISDHLFAPARDAMFAAAETLAARSDLMVTHFFHHAAHAAAERAGVPEVTVTFAPITVPSRHLRPTGAPPLGPWMNALAWGLARRLVTRALAPDINAFRARLGLPPIADVMADAWASRRLNLLAMSPTLCPRPPDWAPHHRVTGALQLPGGVEPLPEPLARFLDAGPPPVFLGFGSLTPTSDRELDALLALAREASTRAACRLVVQVPDGHEARHGRDGEVLVCGRAPHATVFPRCAVLVHHAGAGTSHAAARAGVPSLPVPHVSDQFFWADALHARGIAPRPLARRALTARRLAARLRGALDDAALQARARELGVRLRGEDGVAAAVAAIGDVSRA